MDTTFDNCNNGDINNPVKNLLPNTTTDFKAEKSNEIYQAENPFNDGLNNFVQISDTNNPYTHFDNKNVKDDAFGLTYEMDDNQTKTYEKRPFDSDIGPETSVDVADDVILMTGESNLTCAKDNLNLFDKNNLLNLEKQEQDEDKTCPVSPEDPQHIENDTISNSDIQQMSITESLHTNGHIHSEDSSDKYPVDLDPAHVSDNLNTDKFEEQQDDRIGENSDDNITSNLESEICENQLPTSPELIDYNEESVDKRSLQDFAQDFSEDQPISEKQLVSEDMSISETHPISEEQKLCEDRSFNEKESFSDKEYLQEKEYEIDSKNPFEDNQAFHNENDPFNYENQEQPMIDNVMHLENPISDNLQEKSTEDINLSNIKNLEDIESTSKDKEQNSIEHSVFEEKSNLPEHLLNADESLLADQSLPQELNLSDNQSFNEEEYLTKKEIHPEQEILLEEQVEVEHTSLEDPILSKEQYAVEDTTGIMDVNTIEKQHQTEESTEIEEHILIEEENQKQEEYKQTEIEEQPFTEKESHLLEGQFVHKIPDLPQEQLQLKEQYILDEQTLHEEERTSEKEFIPSESKIETTVSAEENSDLKESEVLQHQSLLNEEIIQQTKTEEVINYEDNLQNEEILSYNEKLSHDDKVQQFDELHFSQEQPPISQEAPRALEEECLSTEKTFEDKPSSSLVENNLLSSEALLPNFDHPQNQVELGASPTKFLVEENQSLCENTTLEDIQLINEEHQLQDPCSIEQVIKEDTELSSLKESIESQSNKDQLTEEIHTISKEEPYVYEELLKIDQSLSAKEVFNEGINEKEQDADTNRVTTEDVIPENIVEDKELPPNIDSQHVEPVEPIADLEKAKENISPHAAPESCDESEDEWNYMRLKKGEAEKEVIKNLEEPISAVEVISEEAIKSTEILDKKVESQEQISEPIEDLKDSITLSCIESPERSDNKIDDSENELAEMNSQLNPEAKEFVPIAHSPLDFELSNGVPPAANLHLVNDDVIAQSPRKGAISMDNIQLPNEDEFESEIVHRPADLEQSETLEQGELYQEMNLKEAMHGSEKEEQASPDQCTFAPTDFENADMKQSIYIENAFNDVEDVLNKVQPLPTEKNEEFEPSMDENVTGDMNRWDVLENRYPKQMSSPIQEINESTQSVDSLESKDIIQPVVKEEIKSTQQIEKIDLVEQIEEVKPTIFEEDKLVQEFEEKIKSIQKVEVEHEFTQKIEEQIKFEEEKVVEKEIIQNVETAPIITAVPALTESPKKEKTDKQKVEEKNLKNKADAIKSNKVPETKKTDIKTKTTTTSVKKVASNTSADLTKQKVAQTSAKAKPATTTPAPRPRTVPLASKTSTEKKTTPTTAAASAAAKPKVEAKSTLTSARRLTPTTKPKIDEQKAGVKQTTKSGVTTKPPVSRSSGTSVTSTSSKTRTSGPTPTSNVAATKTTTQRVALSANAKSTSTVKPITSPRGTLTSTLRKADTVKSPTTGTSKVSVTKTSTTTTTTTSSAKTTKSRSLTNANSTTTTPSNKTTTAGKKLPLTSSPRTTPTTKKSPIKKTPGSSPIKSTEKTERKSVPIEQNAKNECNSEIKVNGVAPAIAAEN